MLGKKRSDLSLVYHRHRPRWKPTQAQTTILEGFFTAGHSKVTQDLLMAVQAAGSATETQVGVWLKNRSARAKRKVAYTRQPELKEMEPGALRRAGGFGALGLQEKRHLRDSEIAAPLLVRDGEVHRKAFTICEQVCKIIQSVSDEDVCRMIGFIHRSKAIFCYGVGREGLVMRSFAMRLYHLGKEVSVVGDMNCPPAAAGDLLILSAGPGYFSTVAALANQGRRNGAHILVLTASADSLEWADSTVRLSSACTMHPDHHHSQADGDPLRERPGTPTQEGLASSEGPLVMGSSYEISLWVFLDCIVSILQDEMDVCTQDMVDRHTNLE